MATPQVTFLSWARFWLLSRGDQQEYQSHLISSSSSSTGDTIIQLLLIPSEAESGRLVLSVLCVSLIRIPWQTFVKLPNRQQQTGSKFLWELYSPSLTRRAIEPRISKTSWRRRTMRTRGTGSLFLKRLILRCCQRVNLIPSKHPNSIRWRTCSLLMPEGLYEWEEWK